MGLKHLENCVEGYVFDSSISVSARVQALVNMVMNLWDPHTFEFGDFD